jgi:serine/threonine protein kinase
MDNEIPIVSAIDKSIFRGALEGESLNKILRSQPLPLPRFLRLMRQICLGLHCAHTGIDTDGDHPELCAVIHRDTAVLVCVKYSELPRRKALNNPCVTH